MYSLNLSRSAGLSSNDARTTASLPNAQARAISPHRAASSQPQHGSHVSLAPRSSNPIGGAGVIVSTAHSAALMQKQDEMLNVTSEHFKAIEAKLEAMHAELKKLDAAAAAAAATAAPSAASARQGSPNFAPVSSRTASASASVSNGPAQKAALTSPGSTTPRPHHLKPLEAEAAAAAPARAPVAAASRAAATAVPISAPAAAPAPAATTADPKKAKAARPGAVTGSFGFDMPAMLDSPGGSSSDDSDSSSSSDKDDDEDAKPTLGKASPMADKSGKSPTPPPARQGVGFGAAGGARASPNGRQGMGFAKPEAPKGAANGTRGRRGIQMNEDGPSPAAGAAGAGAGAGGARRMSGEDGIAMAVGRGVGGKMMDGEHDDARAVDGMDRATKKRNLELVRERKRFFDGIPRLSELFAVGAINRHDMETMSLPGAPCSWLVCAALVLSYVTGVPTTVEKILRTNHLGVHYIALPGVTLAQFYDLINDYIHTRFHRNVSYNGVCADDEFNEDDDARTYLTDEQLARLQHVHCEMAMFNSEIIDPMDSTGEHPPITSLAQFRRELVEHMGEANSLYVFNYDPYIIESNEARLRSNMAETEEEMQAILDNMWYAPNGKGNFGILTDFNPVRHTVTILTPHLLRDTSAHVHDEDANQSPEALAYKQRFHQTTSNLGMEEHTISIQNLYDAVMKQDSYTGLSRGFVRVMVSEQFAPKVKPIFPLFVVDGSSAGGLMTSGLHMRIAPHVLGLAMLHHLTVTFLLTDSARRKQSSRNLLSKANVCDVKLRGIPLTKIVQQLRLPMSMIVSESNPSSLAMSFAWYHVFLQQLQVNQDVRIGLVLPSRRGGAEDGMPNIFEEDFADHLRLVIKTESVMLISFDVNKAQNMRITDTPTAHFGIVIGFDEERGLVRLADVNVRRFGKTWMIPLSRLYNATMGYGYMVAAKDKKTIKALKCKEFQEETLSCAKYRLPPQVEVDTRFEYPAQPYPLTVLADSVDRLGFYANVGRFLNYSGYHISYFLSSHMPLHGAAAVLQNYSHYATDDAFSSVVTHYDYNVHNPPPNDDAETNPLHKMHTEESLRDAIQDALNKADLCRLLVKLDQGVIREDANTWNGSRAGGSYALVLQYEPLMNNVVLLNCDPSSFYRTFTVGLSVLYDAICAFDEEGLRAGGTLLITKEHKQESFYIDTKGYDMAHALVHHPFKPIFSSACSCLALAATEMMVNIEGPTLLGGAPLQVEEDDSRKYKRYNNVFSAEDFLYTLPSFSVHDWILQPELGQDIMAIGTEAFAALNLPLTVVDVLREDPLVTQDANAFLSALEGPGGVLTITLVAYDTDKLHGVPGSSVGLVNRVEFAESDESHTVQAGSAGSVQLIEGDACRWGGIIQCSVEELMRACVGVYCVQENVEDEYENDKDDEEQ